MNIAILLPTYNEEQSIGRVIDEIKNLSNGKWRIIVVDSGSTDRTVSIAKQKKVRIIQLNVRGKGIAIKKAFEQLDNDYLIQIDCDMSYPPKEILRIVEKLEECDVVIGSRFKGDMEKGAMSIRNKFGNKCISLAASLLYLHGVSDVCSGLWGFNKKAYKSITITAKHFELECDLFAESMKKNLKVCEIPIDYKKREGETKLSAIYGFIDMWHLFKKRII